MRAPEGEGSGQTTQTSTVCTAYGGDGCKPGDTAGCGIAMEGGFEAHHGTVSCLAGLHDPVEA